VELSCITRQFLPARRYASVIFAIIACLSVRLSQVGVASKQINIRSRKPRPAVVQELLFYDAYDSDAVAHNGGSAKCIVGWVKLRFATGRNSSALTPYRRKFVAIRYGGPRPRQCAGGGIRGVINKLVVVEVCYQQIRHS